MWIPPYTINVDKDKAYPLAHRELIQSKHLDPHCHLRQIKYLNNSIEGDHNSVKGKCYQARWFQSIHTARPTIDAFETMRMIQKGQLKYAPKGNVCAQNKILYQAFNLAA
jgi:IS6 family transposase